MTVVDRPPVKKSWVPTRKWFYTQVTALTGLALMYVTTGEWNQEETIGAIALVSQAALSYIMPNEDTPGGVPLKRA